MGIMQNKVSRRIALGSVAGGLAGATVVLRALRNAYVTDLSSSTGDGLVEAKKAIQHYQQTMLPPVYKPVDADLYHREWCRDAKVADILAEEADGPATFRLRYAVPEGQAFLATNVCSEYLLPDPLAANPAHPSYYSVTAARISGHPQIGGALPALFIDAGDQLTRSQFHEQTIRGAQCLCALRGGTVEYFDVLDAAAGRKIDPMNVNVPCSMFGSALAMLIPAGHLQVGTTWIDPNALGQYGGISYKVAGFARIGDLRTVEIIADGTASNVPILTTPAISTADAQPASTSHVGPKTGIGQTATIGVNVAAHVSMETGIVVWKSISATTRISEQPEQYQRHTIVTRLLPS